MIAARPDCKWPKGTNRNAVHLSPPPCMMRCTKDRTTWCTRYEYIRYLMVPTCRVSHRRYKGRNPCILTIGTLGTVRQGMLHRYFTWEDRKGKGPMIDLDVYRVLCCDV